VLQGHHEEKEEDVIPTPMFERKGTTEEMKIVPGTLDLWPTQRDQTLVPQELMENTVHAIVSAVNEALSAANEVAEDADVDAARTHVASVTLTVNLARTKAA
jgi:hypothetical protein